MPSVAVSIDSSFPLIAGFFALGAAGLALCENTPSSVHGDNIEDAPISLDHLPIYTSEEVAKNNGDNGTPIWMSYGGMVYDVTKFVANHPGGSEKILQAAGNVSLIKVYSFEAEITHSHKVESSNSVNRTVLVHLSSALCVRPANETYGTHGYW